MKRLIILFMMTLFTTTLSAAIITVDINHPSIGDYKTLQEAHDAASLGDTIYVYPSLSRYDGISVTKQLKIIGAGFLYDSAVNGVYPSRITSMSFKAGSEGSELKGFEAYQIDIETDNITVKNNYCFGIFVHSSANGIIIIHNKIINQSDSSLDVAIKVSSYTHVLISNNIIVSKKVGSYSIISFNDTSLYISHNVIEAVYGALYFSVRVNGIVMNNIVRSGNVWGNSVEYFNNMSQSTQFDSFSGAGNIGNIDMTTVFVDPTNFDYKLKTDSPAIGAGYSGEDLGIYGGNSPYIDNGAGTGIPTIISLIGQPFVPSDSPTMNLSIKATSGITE